MQSSAVNSTPARAPRRRAQAQKALIKVPVDATLKRDADGLFAHLGFDTQTAVRIFLTRAVHSGGIPFAVSDIPYNQETLDAIEESEQLLRDPNAKTYADFSELLNEVLEEMKNDEI